MASVNIRRFTEHDADDVVALFTMVNRRLAPDAIPT